MAKAYVVFEVDVTNEEVYQGYREVGGPLMEAMGGTVLAGTARRETLAGDRTPQKLFIVEFPSYEAGLEFYRSPQYQAVIGIRDQSAISNTYLVEGVD
jgi:uncharacterized protein (DUF1330 family)